MLATQDSTITTRTSDISRIEAVKADCVTIRVRITIPLLANNAASNTFKPIVIPTRLTVFLIIVVERRTGVSRFTVRHTPATATAGKNAISARTTTPNVVRGRYKLVTLPVGIESQVRRTLVTDNIEVFKATAA
jgi:hypothetical protein